MRCIWSLPWSRDMRLVHTETLMQFTGTPVICHWALLLILLTSLSHRLRHRVIRLPTGVGSLVPSHDEPVAARLRMPRLDLLSVTDTVSFCTHTITDASTKMLVRRKAYLRLARPSAWLTVWTLGLVIQSRYKLLYSGFALTDTTIKYNTHMAKSN